MTEDTKDLMQSPPWVAHARKIKAMFKYDDDVNVVYDEDEIVVRLLVRGQAKADALDKLLVHEVEFGNVKLTVSVVPANEDATPVDVCRDAFYGNEAVSEIYTADEGFADGMAFVVFEPDVSQFFNDNLASPFGVESYLYEDIARDIFALGGAVFSTDVDELAFGTPLGEWP